MVTRRDAAEQGFPDRIPNLFGGVEKEAVGGEWLVKRDPATADPLLQVARSDARDAAEAVALARACQPEWAAVPPVRRGMILGDVAMALKARREEMGRAVALETGKSFRDALGETDGAVALGLFMAGEGQRLYGRTTTSGTAGKFAMTVRQPVGVAGLIVAANTPVANVAWKVFPALIGGNAAVLKAAEDTPLTAHLFGRIAFEAGLPGGALQILQGYGHEAGAALVANADVDVISFTGSTRVGREIAQVAARRLGKVSLELGGKNPLLVCEDADIDLAVRWAALSAFSNAGQRCASASRLIVHDAVYDTFVEKLVAKARSLRVGPGDDDDLGPVINERQLENMRAAVREAIAAGAKLLVGGERLRGSDGSGGYYMAPTLLENVLPDAPISRTELFGPIACLYRAKSYEESLGLANDSPYGLTACIHTRNVHRAQHFCRHVRSGVAVVNAGTYGSEPHMPFGGVKDSGNGWREPGTEALDIYTELKDVYLQMDEGAVW